MSSEEKKIKVFIGKDEWYPVHFIGETYGIEVEITEDFKKEYDELMNAFDKMQDKLITLHESKNDD